MVEMRTTAILAALAFAVPFAAWARQGTILLYPTALKTEKNILACAEWRKPLASAAPHAVATRGVGGPLSADAPALSLANTHPEFAYWGAHADGIRTDRTYFFGAWAKIDNANLLFWCSGTSAATKKSISARVYCNSGCLPTLERYFDDDIKRRLSGDSDAWRIVARTFSLAEPVADDRMMAEFGFFKTPGKATFAEPFLIDVTDAQNTLEVELRGVKPVKSLLVVRLETHDPDWRKEFETPVTDFAERLPAKCAAFEGMGADPMAGRALVVTYADGGQDRVACPAEGLFLKR